MEKSRPESKWFVKDGVLHGEGDDAEPKQIV
jgi:hypothetical protein